MRDPLVIQKPVGLATRLILLFHGVGGQPENLLHLGQCIASALPGAAVLSIAAPGACDMGAGYQWFSVRGVTEDNRVGRVAEAMPRFMTTVRHWQDAMGVAPASTALVGFSQGAIMALESTQLPAPLASCVVGLSGRFARPPQGAHADTAIHLIHGTADAVMPVAQSIEAAHQLSKAGARVTLDTVPMLGHGVNVEVEALVVQRLTGHFA